MLNKILFFCLFAPCCFAQDSVRVNREQLLTVIHKAEGLPIALEAVDSLKDVNEKQSNELADVYEKASLQSELIDTLKAETVELKAKSTDKDGIIKAEKGKRNKARLALAASIVLNVALIIILL